MIRKQALYTSDRPFKPWLYQIAINLANDRFRELRKETERTSAMDGHVAAAVPSPSETASHRDFCSPKP